MHTPTLEPERKRSVEVRVMLTPIEREELLHAAKKAETPVSALMRALALACVRRGETIGVRMAAG